MARNYLGPLQRAQLVADGDVDPASLTPRMVKQMCEYILKHNPGWIVRQTEQREVAHLKFARDDALRALRVMTDKADQFQKLHATWEAEARKWMPTKELPKRRKS